MVQSLPATDKQIKRMKHHQEEDEEYQDVIHYMQSGWQMQQSEKGTTNTNPYQSLETALAASSNRSF